MYKVQLAIWLNGTKRHNRQYETWYYDEPDALQIKTEFEAWLPKGWYVGIPIISYV